MLLARLLHLALVAPETGEADCGEEFLVSARNTFPLSQHLAVVTSVLFPPRCDEAQPQTTFPCCFNRRRRFANAALSIIELLEVRIGSRQMGERHIQCCSRRAPSGYSRSNKLELRRRVSRSYPIHNHGSSYRAPSRTTKRRLSVPPKLRVHLIAPLMPRNSAEERGQTCKAQRVH